jgi:hypothetical protein
MISTIETAAPAEPTNLLVHHEGNWFRAPERPVVHCRSRRSIRLLLAKLALHRQLHPGVPLDREQLREIGWPNERMSPLSARNRLKQAMRILRRLGMGDLLVWQNGGYFIRPDMPFELAH